LITICFLFSFLIVKNFVQDFFSSVGSFRSHDQGCWFRILVQFNFDVSFLFHHLTLNYWALSFLFFSLSFLWGYLKSHVSQVNLSCFGFFQCFFFFSSFDVGLLGLEISYFFMLFLSKGLSRVASLLG
jgi:hypothetical protein